MLFVPEAELQGRDNWDQDVQGERQARWTGQGGVLESLPAQMEAGTRSAVASLRHMLAEESAIQRRSVVDGPASGETPAGAATGRAAPGSIDRQARLLSRNKSDLETAVSDARRAIGDLQAVTPGDMTTAQQAMSALAQSAPSTVLGIAAGILTRNPGLTMTIAGGGGGAIQAGATYGEAREKGATHRLSAMAATIDAVLEGVGEALPLRIALKRGSPIATRILNTIIAEAGQEAATQVMQDLNAYATYNPDITFNEVWHNLKVATLAGGMGGALYGGIGAVGDRAAGMPAAGEAPAQSADAVSATPVINDGAAISGESGQPAGRLAGAIQRLGDKIAAVRRGTTEQPTGLEAAAGETAGVQSGLSAAGYLDQDVQALPAVTAQPSGRALALTEQLSESSQDIGTGGTAAVPLGNASTPEASSVTATEFLSQPLNARSEPVEPLSQEAVDEDGWAAFPAESGSLGIPRAEMPQIKAAHRGALVNFLAARDITHTTETVPAESLKPTQQEYSPEKVLQAQSFEGGDRSILVSSDNHIIDGHHQWLASRGTEQPVRIIRLNVPVRELLPMVSEFPSAQTEATAEGGAAEAATAEIGTEVTKTPKEDSDITELAAGTGVVMTPPYTAAGGEVHDSVNARPDAIRQTIRDLFNVPLNEGHFKQSRDTLGIFKVKPRTIRVRNQNDIGVIAHETGHHFSETSQPVRELMKTHFSELSQITPYAAQQKTAALKREEGFAEYLRLLWTEPTKAKARAPGFHAGFAEYIDKNSFRPAFERVAGAIQDWQNLPPADRIHAKIGQAPQRPDPKAILDRFIFEVLDRWLPLKQMVRDLNPGIAPSKDPFKAAHLLAGDGAIIEDWIAHNTVPFDPVRRADPRNYGKPLRKILQPVAGELKAFNAYLIARRAAELMRHGKERLFTEQEIRAGLSLETPAFKQAAKEIYAFNDSLIDYAVEGGLLSSSTAGKLRQYSAYIPFFRESGDGERAGGGKNPFKRLLGGTENLRDPVANLIQNAANIIYATNRNAVLQKARALANEVRGGGRWIEDIPVPDAILEVPTRSVLEALGKQGVALDQDALQALNQIQRLVVPRPVDDLRERIVIIRVEGQPKAVQINNDMLWRALQSFEPADLGFIEHLLTIPADLLRSGVTLSPEFMARNFMRDTLSGFMQSKPGIFPVVGTVSGFKEVATRTDAAKLFRAFGGAHADLWKGDSQQTRDVLERMAKRGRFDPRTIMTPGGILQLLNDLGSITEAGTRVAEFKGTASVGSPAFETRRRAKLPDIDSLVDAAYNAREVSVDFGMHGASQNIRLLTRITPFLNPAMQGFYKMARTSRERFMTTLLRGSMLTAFSVALLLQNRDEDWYDEIEFWERNVYWHVDIGFRNKDGQVIPIRIPKPFEWGAVFGSVPESLTEVVIDQNGGEFAKRLRSVVTDVFGLRAVPTAALVPMELWANRNMFTGRQIVSEGMERLDPELQYTAGTSLAAREAGTALGMSPAHIDHAIRGFLGTMGVYATSLADVIVRPLGDYPEKPSATMRDIPVVRAFVHDSTSPNSRYVSEFYELLSKARRAEASMRQLDGERAAEYYEKHRDLIDAAPALSGTAREIAAIRREAREVSESRDYSPNEKRRLINDGNREIRQAARSGVRDVLGRGAGNAGN